MIETEVHQRLRAYLREQGHTHWPHHLTMARLVARALRVGRSALIQTDSLAAYQGSYRLSYLIPALLWPEPAILVLPEDLIETVLHTDIPNLQQRLPVIKPVQAGDRWPNADFSGLLVTAAATWLSDRLSGALGNTVSAPLSSGSNSYLNGSCNLPFPQERESRFPSQIPTLIDGANQLETWIRSELSISLTTQDWDALTLAYPSQREYIRDMRVRITYAVLQHPANPYSCHLIDSSEQALLRTLYERLQIYGSDSQMPRRWQTFWQRFFQTERLAWSQINRDLGSIVLCCGPTDIDQLLAPVWQQQPVVLIGAALDADKQATRYRMQLGLGEMTCLKFGPDRRHDWIQLYLPDRLPMPNTSQFKAAALQEIRRLLGAKNAAKEPVSEPKTHQISGKTPGKIFGKTPGKASEMSGGPTVIIVGDVPLRAHFASVLAAEFGSRVQLESPIGPGGILVTGWSYWLAHQSMFDPPSLLIITTLPIPSLENPLVAGRVAAYKRRRQDWFKAYLLPEALSTLQEAIASVRSRENENAETSVVALLDNRVNYRSYGAQVIAALSPAARSSYLDLSWFSSSQFSSTSTGIDQA